MENFNQSVIKHKTGLLNLAAELGNVSKACRIMGFSRDTFYRYQAARDAGGVEALFDVSRRKPNLKNRVEETQVQALERKKHDNEACGEIESHHPGYLGSQDTFYVGTMKGVGRIYQQTFVDTYSKWAAVEHLCRHCLTENKSGRKRSHNSTDRTKKLPTKQRLLSDQV